MAGSGMWDRLAALSGAAGAALTVAYVLLSDPHEGTTNPNPNQTSAMIARALVANRDDARAGCYLGLAGAFLLLWFFGYLGRHLRRAEGEEGWLASVAYGSGLVAVGLVLIMVGITFAESELSSYGDDPQVAKTYFVFGWNAAVILAPPLGALAAATTVVGFRFAALPTWLNWIGALIVAMMLGMSPFTPGLVSLLGVGWIALVSLGLFVRTWQQRSLETRS